VTGADLQARQLQFAAERLNIDIGAVAEVVGRWMEREPLPVLPQCTWPELTSLLTLARDRSLKLGVLSDYPAREKLDALGLLAYFDVIVSAQDPDVQTFKPDPRGLHIALHRLGVQSSHALYIGDRPDTDAATARNGGVACAIVGHRRRTHPEGWLEFEGYAALREILFEI
jgi:FMN phosphatase YigB (HAD superfamily)